MDLHFPLLLLYAAGDILGGKLSQKLKFEWKNKKKFKKQVLQDYSLFGKTAWVCTLQVEESTVFGNSALHFGQINKSWGHNEKLW